MPFVLGDWIDLKAAENIHLEGPYALTKSKKKGEESRKVVLPTKLIPLGVAMQLPKGMEAIVVPRSSSYKNFHIIQSNHMGVIDNKYCGNEDQWYMPVIALGEVNIKEGSRICQFKIQPSQKATVWQKLKWLFTNKIEFEIVDNLNNPNRGGLGHTGIK